MSSNIFRYTTAEPVQKVVQAHNMQSIRMILMKFGRQTLWRSHKLVWTLKNHYVSVVKRQILCLHFVHAIGIFMLNANLVCPRLAPILLYYYFFMQLPFAICRIHCPFLCFTTIACRVCALCVCPRVCVCACCSPLGVAVVLSIFAKLSI